MSAASTKRLLLWRNFILPSLVLLFVLSLIIFITVGADLLNKFNQYRGHCQSKSTLEIPMFFSIPTIKLFYSLRSIYPLTALIQENMVHNDKIIKCKYRKSAL